MTESFDEVCTSYDYCTWVGRDGVKRAIDRLKAAHESEIAELQRQYEQNVIELQRAHKREMEAVRDPQRIGGTLERDSFEYALEQLREFRWQHATNDNDAIPYINGIAKAHEHEMEHVRKAEYHRGYEAGQRSMEAKHRTVTERLVKLDLAGGSHENLSAIASCFYQPTFGWTRGACEELRNMLIKTLEDKDGNDDNDNSDGRDYGHHRCDQHQVSCYDELGTSLSDLYGIWQDGEESENKDSESARKMTKSAEIGKSDERVRQLEHDVEMWRDRAEDMRMERDELRQTIDKMTVELDSARAKNRRLTQHIAQMQGGSKKWREKCEALTAANADLAKGIDDARESEYRAERQRDELLSKLDDYDKTHVTLPKDANGEVWHIGDESEYGEVTGILFNSTRTLIEIRMGNGERNMFGVSLAHKANPVTVEQVIRDLTLGKITEAQAIERIDGVNGQV